MKTITFGDLTVLWYDTCYMKLELTEQFENAS